MILSIDIGTSSIRACIFNLDGQELPSYTARQSYSMNYGADGSAEIDADLLFNYTCQVIDALLTNLGDQSQPSAQKLTQPFIGVAISTFWHGLMAIDDSDQALTPLISWNDTRSTLQAAQLRANLDEMEMHRRTGCRAHASYWPAKILWLQQIDAERFAKISALLSFGDYLYLRLFGVRATSISLASATGLLNQHSCQWDDATLAHLPINSDQLPPLRDHAETLNGLLPPFAARWPALKSIPWFLAVGDGACSNVGSGCITPERGAIMIGTSAAMRIVERCADFTIPDELWCYRIDKEHIVMGGALSNGGNLYEWLLKSLNLPQDAETLTNELRGLVADSHGLTFLPLLSGERSPGWHDNATGALVGLNIATRPIEILRATMEAVAIQFGEIYAALASSGTNLPKMTELIATGGALYHSPLWREIIADLLGIPLKFADIAEASSRGAALLALRSLNYLTTSDIQQIDIVSIHQPHSDNYQRYQKAWQRYRALYQTLVSNDWAQTH